MKKFLIQRILRKCGVQLCLHNVFGTGYKKNCLILYVQDPFFSSKGQRFHQSHEQLLIIAKIFSELGYNVDVTDYKNRNVKLNKMYDAVFDICVQTPMIYEHNLKENAKRIVYFTGCESAFANGEELKRIEQLELRRGVKLMPRRQAPPTDKHIKDFDAAIFIGSQICVDTYKNLLPVSKYLLPNTGYDFGDRFDFTERKSTSFIYFGSSGCVHKGLDLLLEIFKVDDFPCKLFVCGTFRDEDDFYREYVNEIENSKNIVPIGFTDIWSDKFKELCSECTFAVLPSCSETLAGTIITCMSAGLIPICSKICGFNSDEAILLEDCSIDTIRKCILAASTMDADTIKSLRERSLNLTKTKFSIQNYEESLRTALIDILKVNDETPVCCNPKESRH